MESHWYIIFLPLALPLTAAATGGLMGFFTVAKYRSANLAPNLMLFALTALAIIAATIPNAGQQLYELGISFPVIDILQGASYFVLAFAIVGAWRLLVHFWAKWLLILILSVAFVQPLLWTFAYIVWSIGGFAP